MITMNPVQRDARPLSRAAHAQPQLEAQDDHLTTWKE